MVRIIILDVGTSSIRAATIDENANILIMSRRKYQPRAMGNGKVEQNPSSWITGLREVVADCLENLDGAIDALAITSARSSLIAIDEDGLPVSDAIMWQDNRADGIVSEFSDAEDWIYQRTGMRLSNITSCTKMLWLHRNRPSLYRNCVKLTGIQGFLLRQLTGRFVTDSTFGNRTGLMNIHTRCWDNEIIHVLGLDSSKLVSLLTPGEIAGKITSEASRLTGLKEGIPVISAGGDQQCAAVGQGVVKPGIVSVNTGTGAFIVKSLGKIVHDPLKGLLVNLASLKGQYILEAIIPAAGSLYEWFCHMLNMQTGDNSRLHKQIDIEIENTPPGSHGVISIPDFSGQGSPRWNRFARGAFLNLSIGNNRGDLARALLEGVVAEISENLERMRRLAGVEESIYSSGGLSVFTAYDQMLSDNFGSKVNLCNYTESTVLGAWVVTAVRLGLYPNYEKAFANIKENGHLHCFHPDLDRAKYYKKRNLLRKKIYESLCSMPLDEHYL